MQETRQNKIARLLQKELSLIFQQQTRATHGVMISVTRTKISPDLSICTAYLSVFPSEKGEEILSNINANSKQIRNCDSLSTTRSTISSISMNC